jgi:hypothetical protein
MLAECLSLTPIASERAVSWLSEAYGTGSPSCQVFLPGVRTPSHASIRCDRERKHETRAGSFASNLIESCDRRTGERSQFGRAQ